MKEKELTALLPTQDRFFFSIISYKKRLSSSLSQYLLINLVVLCPIFEIRRSCLTYSYAKSYAGYVNKYRKRERGRGGFTWASTWRSAQTGWTPKGFFRQRSSDSPKNYSDWRPQTLLMKKRNGFTRCFLLLLSSDEWEREREGDLPYERRMKEQWLLMAINRQKL